THLQAFLSHRSVRHARERDRPRPLHRALRGETAQRARLGRERRARQGQSLRSAVPRFKMSRVLVVEDEQHLAEGLRFNLESEGYEVEVVDTGEGALESLLARE